MSIMGNWPVKRQPIFSERLMIQKLLELSVGEAHPFVKAVLDVLDKPQAGRLIYLPWGAGSKCIPGLCDDDEDTHGGRC